VHEKPASADHEIHDLLARRWSPRAFSDRSIDPAVLARLFEAARWAPSSGNGQPWSYLVARREEEGEFEKLASTLSPGNAWARKAAALAISVAALDRAPGKPNGTALHDLGLANENLAIQATALGLAVHMMAGFSAEKASEIFAIPERHVAVAAIAIGYPGDPETLPEELRQKDMAPRHRKAVHEFVFQGTWGQPGRLQ
jgi:nitroreductase